MIFFDGVNLETVAPVRIEDIRISPIQFSPVTRPRAVRGGSVFVRPHDGTRTVAITFALLKDNMLSRSAFLADIRQWAKHDKEYRLELPTVPGKYLSCVCTAHPEPSTRQWWESKLRLVFTCYENPYWTDSAEKTVPCGTAFYAMGDAEPLMWITATRAAAETNQEYSNGAETMTFSTIPAGDMVIDLENQAAEVNHVSFMSAFTFTSQFVRPRMGLQAITGTGTVHYRERWT